MGRSRKTEEAQEEVGVVNGTSTGHLVFLLNQALQSHSVYFEMARAAE